MRVNVWEGFSYRLKWMHAMTSQYDCVGFVPYKLPKAWKTVAAVTAGGGGGGGQRWYVPRAAFRGDEQNPQKTTGAKHEEKKKKGKGRKGRQDY